MGKERSWICDGVPRDGKVYPEAGFPHEPSVNYGPDCVVCGLPKEAVVWSAATTTLRPWPIAAGIAVPLIGIGFVLFGWRIDLSLLRDPPLVLPPSQPSEIGSHDSSTADTDIEAAEMSPMSSSLDQDSDSDLQRIVFYFLGMVPPTVGVILGFFLSRRASREADKEIQRYLQYDYQSIKTENYSLKQEMHQKDEQIRQLMASRSPQDD